MSQSEKKRLETFQRSVALRRGSEFGQYPGTPSKLPDVLWWATPFSNLARPKA